MAGRLPSFASGSNLAIYVGGMSVAYGTNISWSDDVAHGAVGGIGSYNYDALEPLQYLARGSFTIVRYGSAAFNQTVGKTPSGSQLGATAAPARSEVPATGIDGNTMLRPGSFNPSKMLIGRTFDIAVYERGAGGALSTVAAFNIKDCRLTAYSITFTPGQLVSEQLGFICLAVLDGTTQPAGA